MIIEEKKTVTIGGELWKMQVIEWITGNPNDETSIVIHQEDPETGKRRHCGVTPGCFWTDWE